MCTTLSGFGINRKAMLFRSTILGDRYTKVPQPTLPPSDVLKFKC